VGTEEGVRRKAEWNKVHRAAAKRLRQENPDRYADLFAEEAALAGLQHQQSPRRHPVTPVPDLTPAPESEEDPTP